MICLVDLTCRAHSLSHDEFVAPVARIVDGAGHGSKEMHFSEITTDDLEGATGIILCGTALKDNQFATRRREFFWLRNVSVPVLGICAGMQILCLVFGGTIRPGCEIGMTEIRTVSPDPILPWDQAFQGFELHSFICDPPPGWLVTSVSDGGAQSIRHPERPFYGVMFHPEVRNKEIVERFLALCQRKVP